MLLLITGWIIKKKSYLIAKKVKKFSVCLRGSKGSFECPEKAVGIHLPNRFSNKQKLTLVAWSVCINPELLPG